MKKILPLLLLLPITALAQLSETKGNYVKQQISIDLGFTGAQVGVELVAGPNKTFLFRTGLTPLLYNTTNINTGQEKLTLLGAWSVSAEFRSYYNFNKRLQKEKSINNNGANYIGFLATYFTRPFGDNSQRWGVTSGIMAGPSWGFNRPLGEKSFFNLNLGPVLQHEFDNNETSLTLFADVRFGFIINSK